MCCPEQGPLSLFLRTQKDSKISKYKTNGLDQASPIYSYQTKYTGNLAGNFCMEKQTKFSPVGSVKKKRRRGRMDRSKGPMDSLLPRSEPQHYVCVMVFCFLL